MPVCFTREKTECFSGFRRRERSYANVQTIYLNHAGTSWPKPPAVLEATREALNTNPIEWPELFQAARKAVARFFHVESSSLLLTPSCTAALQLAVQDHPWRSGDRVLTSHFEHHALHRPLLKLEELGVKVTTLPFGDDEPLRLEALESELKAGGVRLLALTAACNVTGRLLPVKEAIALAHRYGALALVDGAQIAGWWDLDLTALDADFFTFAGHKGPQGPWGVGGLYVRPEIRMNCPAATCDLSKPRATADMPGYCDAGSVNLVALLGLAAACWWLSEPAQQGRLQAARGLAQELAEALREMPRVTLHHDVSVDNKVPTVAMSVAGVASSKLANQLQARGVIASAGLQCAPQAHRALNTAESGVLRFSFGPSSHSGDVQEALERLEHILH